MSGRASRPADRERHAAPLHASATRVDVRLADVECVLIRKDPPFDAEYLYVTLMLEKLRGRTLVVNDPRGLRDANEKLYALHFARHMPRTLVTADRDRIHRFVAELGDRPSSSRSTARAAAASWSSTRATATPVRSSTSSPREGTRHAMVQEYLPAVRAGRQARAPPRRRAPRRHQPRRARRRRALEHPRGRPRRALRRDGGRARGRSPTWRRASPPTASSSSGSTSSAAS